MISDGNVFVNSDWTLRAPWGDEYRVRLAISIGYESFETVVDVLMITSVDDLDFLISLNFEVNSITWDILATEIIMPTINNEAITLINRYLVAVKI